MAGISAPRFLPVHSRQRVAHVGHGGPAIHWVPLKAAAEHIPHAFRRHDAERRYLPLGEGLEPVLKDLHGRGPGGPRPLARKHREDRQAPTPDVGLVGKSLPGRLLRGTISGRARGTGHQGLSNRRLVVLVAAGLAGLVGLDRRFGLGQPEIGDFGYSFPRHQDIQRLDVLVDEPSGVSGLQPPGELDGNVEDPFQRGEPTVADPLLQRAAFDVLGKQDHLVLGRAEEPAGRNVRMLGQVDPGAQLVEKRPAVTLLADQLGENPLDREPLAAGLALDQVDVAHSAVAQAPLDLIVAQKHLADLPGRRLLRMGFRAGARRGACLSRARLDR